MFLCFPTPKLAYSELPACHPAMSASAASECNEVKESVYCNMDPEARSTKDGRRYDSCFLKWYSESKAATTLLAA